MRAADIGFLIGAPKGSPEWKYFVDYAKRVVDSFDVSAKGVHIGAMTFAAQPRLGFRFNTWRGQRYTRANVKGALSRLTPGAGKPSISRGLAATRTQLFGNDGGMRPHVPKV